MAGIVATEIMALAWRHWLLERLSGRSDILSPATITPGLTQRIGRFLVAGLDYVGEPGVDGWPVPTGGRYSKLCFSPALDQLGPIVAGPHVLPIKMHDYLAYVETICGIDMARAGDLFRLFRFTPAWLFEQTADLRDGNGEGWRLLLSNEFRLARQYHPHLGRPIAGSAFRYPLIDGFMVIAELERAFLIMRHLGRAQAIADRPALLDELSRSMPLGSWLRPTQLRELLRWLEYASFSSTSLRKLMFDLSPADIAGLPPGFGPWAAARGEVGDQSAEIFDHAAVRAILSEALTPPPVTGEQKKPLLRNKELCRWYGLTNRVLPTVAIDGIRDNLPTKRAVGAKAFAPSPDNKAAWLFIAELASAMRGRADKKTQDAVADAARSYVGTAGRGDLPELHSNSRAGLKWALMYLPTRPRDGSGARFDHTMWLTPRRDASFWQLLLDVRRGGRSSRFSLPTGKHMRSLIGILRRAFGALYHNARWTNLTARIVCDLAAAIGPISGNPDIAYALHVFNLKPRIQRRLGVTNRGGFGKGKKVNKSSAKFSIK